jgi:hypothetical protein
MKGKNSFSASIPQFRPPDFDGRLIKYLKVEALPEQIGRVEDLWKEAEALLTPAAAWTLLPLETFMSRLPAKDRTSAALARWVEGCDQVALLAVSIGEDLEVRARGLFDLHESFAGYLLDRMGSYMAECWMAILDRHVQEVLAREHFVCKRRYSPGYADTSLGMQEQFLEFARRRIPFLRSSDAHFLLPEKSVFALKGVRRSLHIPDGRASNFISQ